MIDEEAGGPLGDDDDDDDREELETPVHSGTATPEDIGSISGGARDPKSKKSMGLDPKLIVGLVAICISIVGFIGYQNWPSAKADDKSKNGKAPEVDGEKKPEDKGKGQGGNSVHPPEDPSQFSDNQIAEALGGNLDSLNKHIQDVEQRLKIAKDEAVSFRLRMLLEMFTEQRDALTTLPAEGPENVPANKKKASITPLREHPKVVELQNSHRNPHPWMVRVAGVMVPGPAWSTLVLGQLPALPAEELTEKLKKLEYPEFDSDLAGLQNDKNQILLRTKCGINMAQKLLTQNELSLSAEVCKYSLALLAMSTSPENAPLQKLRANRLSKLTSIVAEIENQVAKKVESALKAASDADMKATIADEKAVKADDKAVAADDKAVIADAKAVKADEKAVAADVKAVKADEKAEAADVKAEKADKTAMAADEKAVKADAKAVKAETTAMAANELAVKASAQASDSRRFTLQQVQSMQKVLAARLSASIKKVTGKTKEDLVENDKRLKEIEARLQASIEAAKEAKPGELVIDEATAKQLNNDFNALIEIEIQLPPDEGGGTSSANFAEQIAEYFRKNPVPPNMQGVVAWLNGQTAKPGIIYTWFESVLADLRKDPTEQGELAKGLTLWMRNSLLAHRSSWTGVLHDLDGLPARVAELEKLLVRITAIEKLPPRIAELEKLPPRVAAVEKLPSRVVELEKLPVRVTELEKLSPRIANLETVPPRVAKLEELSIPTDKTLKELASRLKKLEEQKPPPLNHAKYDAEIKLMGEKVTALDAKFDDHLQDHADKKSANSVPPEVIKWLKENGYPPLPASNTPPAVMEQLIDGPRQGAEECFRRGFSAFFSTSPYSGQEAAVQFARAVQLEPKESMNRYFYGLSLRKVGRIDEAVEHVRYAAQQERKNGATDYFLRLEKVQGESRQWLERIRHTVIPESR